MANRQAAQDFIIKWIDRLIPGGQNKKIYEELFAKMDDAQFDAFMDQIKKKQRRLSAVAPNFSDAKMSLDSNFDIAEELGHNFFQRIWVPGKNGARSYLTPVPYPVIDLPMRRQAQHLRKKASIAPNQRSVDNFTGQVTGDSKSAKFSYPEIACIAAMGLDDCLRESLKYRGGDEKGSLAMHTMIRRNGEVELESVKPYASGVKSTQTLSAFLNAAMLSSTLMRKK